MDQAVLSRSSQVPGWIDVPHPKTAAILQWRQPSPLCVPPVHRKPQPRELQRQDIEQVCQKTHGMPRIQFQPIFQRALQLGEIDRFRKLRVILLVCVSGFLWMYYHRRPCVLSRSKFINPSSFKIPSDNSIITSRLSFETSTPRFLLDSHQNDTICNV